MNVVSTHSVNPSMTEFTDIESELDEVPVVGPDPSSSSTRGTMMEPAFSANSTRASSTAYIFFGSIVLVFYMPCM